MIRYTTDGSKPRSVVAAVGLDRPARAGRGVPHHDDDHVPVDRDGHQGQRLQRQGEVHDQVQALTALRAARRRRAARLRRRAVSRVLLALASRRRRGDRGAVRSAAATSRARRAPRRRRGRARPARVPPPRRRRRARVLRPRVPGGGARAGTIRGRRSRRSRTRAWKRGRLPAVELPRR